MPYPPVPTTGQQTVLVTSLVVCTLATACFIYAAVSHRIDWWRNVTLVAAGLAVAWWTVTAMSGAMVPPPNCSIEGYNGSGPPPFMPCN